jgi:uncharacterized membrane protein
MRHLGHGYSWGRSTRESLLVPALLVACAGGGSADSAGQAISSSSDTSGTDAGDSSDGDVAGDGDGDMSGEAVGDGDAASPGDSSGDLGGQGQGGSVQGEESACLRLLSVGTPAVQGVVPGMGGLDAIVGWLNTSSNVSAEHRPDPLPFTMEGLDDFDLVLLQDLSALSLTSQDKEAFAQWVKAGGAVIALSGYEANDVGVARANQLLSFTGLSFSVAALDTALALSDCGYCLGSSVKTAGFNPSHPISEGVTAVGSFLGRAVQGDGEVVISEAGQTLAVSKEVELGRVLMYHDDWITYVTQWTGQVSSSCETNPSCSEESPLKSYQVGRFWSNALKWAVPQADCLLIDSLNGEEH